MQKDYLITSSNANKIIDYCFLALTRRISNALRKNALLDIREPSVAVSSASILESRTFMKDILISSGPSGYFVNFPQFLKTRADGAGLRDQVADRIKKSLDGIFNSLYEEDIIGRKEFLKLKRSTNNLYEQMKTFPREIAIIADRESNRPFEFSGNVPTIILDPEMRKGFLSLPEWLRENKTTFNDPATSQLYLDKISALNKEEGSNSIAHVFEATTIDANRTYILIEGGYSKELARKLGIVEIISEDERANSITLAHFMNKYSIDGLEPKEYSIYENHFLTLIEEHPTLVILKDKKETLTVEDTIKYRRSGGGSESVYIDLKVIDYFVENKYEEVVRKLNFTPEETSTYAKELANLKKEIEKPKKLEEEPDSENYISISDFGDKIPGGSGRYLKEHNEEIRLFLIRLKITKPNLEINLEPGKEDGVRINISDAVKYYEINNKKVSLRVHEALEGYVLDNFKGRKSDNPDFLSKTQALRNGGISIFSKNSQMTKAIGVILEDLWQRREDKFMLDEERQVIGDYVKRLVSGKNSGIFVHEKALGSLVTKEDILQKSLDLEQLGQAR